jgi:hypothetical protein
MDFHNEFSVPVLTGQMDEYLDGMIRTIQMRKKDMRIEDREMMYVAMYVVMKSGNRQLLDRVIEFGEQVKWEINNRRENKEYVQDNLF